MKPNLPILNCLFILLGLTAQGQVIKHPYLDTLEKQNITFEKVIKVSNAEEFVKALGNNTAILLDSGAYFFKDKFFPGQGRTKGHDYLGGLSGHYDNRFIHDLENLAIIGADSFPAYIIQPYHTYYVWEFKNVKNLFLYNLVMEHEPDYSCSGGVIYIENGRDINLENLELRGSGSEGLTLKNVNDFSISNSTITECSEQLGTFTDTKNATIDQCRFNENEFILRGFTIDNSQISFKNSRIETKYPFHEDPLRYDGPFDVLFLIDHYFAPEKDSLSKLLNNKIAFTNTVINEDTINHEYNFFDYTDPGFFEYGVPIAEYPDLLILFHDMYIEGTHNERPPGDTVNIFMGLGSMPGDGTLQIVKSDLKEIIKIEQQLENSLAISFEGPHHDLVNWKHYTSPWEEVPKISPNTYNLLKYTDDELNKFPEYTLEELIKYLNEKGFEGSADYVAKHACSPLYVAPSMVRLRITAIDKDDKIILRLLCFHTPMGC